MHASRGANSCRLQRRLFHRRRVATSCITAAAEFNIRAILRPTHADNWCLRTAETALLPFKVAESIGVDVGRSVSQGFNVVVTATDSKAMQPTSVNCWYPASDCKSRKFQQKHSFQFCYLQPSAAVAREIRYSVGMVKPVWMPRRCGSGVRVPLVS